MSLGSGLLFFVFIVCLAGLCCLFVPIRLSFSLEHQTEWHITILIQLWRMKKNIQISNKMSGQLDLFLQKSVEKQQKINHSVQIHWKSTFVFLRRALQIAAKRILIERLSVNCRIGWNRADYTAYSYGLFWTLISILPAKWFQNSQFVYVPDFQHLCRNISVQGIISCSVGQLISILIAWFRLTIQMLLEQNRNEEKGVNIR